jgi:hypothetical protein
MRAALTLLALALPLASGCSAFRLEVGAGTGLGASVKVPYFYNGGLLTPSVEVRTGHNYAEGWHAAHGGEPAEVRASKDYDVALILGAAEARAKTWAAATSAWIDPFGTDRARPDLEGILATYSLLPIGWSGDQPSSHALELNLHLLLSLHVGWNPFFWYTRPEERMRTLRPGFLPADEFRRAPPPAGERP